MELTASTLITVPPDQRDKLYKYPYTGPYHDEPELYEILHRQEMMEIWGPNSLAIHHTCPACGSNKAEWVRNEWSICYQCLLAFDTFERYIDLSADEEMEYTEDE